MATDPKLPPLESVSEWVKATRTDLDMTLSELGEAAHLSPSQLSRLENSEGNPSYEAVYRVYRELTERQGEATVAAILRSKRTTHGDLDFEYVTPEDTCARAAELLDAYDISQVPVIADGHAVGGLTDTTLMELTELDTPVEEAAGPPFPEVSVTTDRETVRNLLRTTQAVLLTAAPETDLEPVVGQYVGIVTAADFR